MMYFRYFKIKSMLDHVLHFLNLTKNNLKYYHFYQHL